MDTISVNGKAFQVLSLLGKGKGGYSYLVTDGHKRYTLKQIHHEPCNYYQFGDKLASELMDYQRLRDIGIPMPELLDADLEQERILKEYIEGDTVYTKVIRNEMEDWYFHQVRAMCDRLYPAGLNIDYFPTNFIPKDGVLYYIDYECNGYMEQWDFDHWGNLYWWKSPEFLEYDQNKGKSPAL